MQKIVWPLFNVGNLGLGLCRCPGMPVFLSDFQVGNQVETQISNPWIQRNFTKVTLAKVVKFKFRLFNFEMPKILNETFQMATVLSKPSSTLTVQNVISLLKNLNVTKVQILKFRNSKLESERGSKNQLNR